MAAIAFATVAAQCQPSYVGTPCVPSEEYDEAFLGYDPGEVRVDTTSDPNIVCLVYHFRGRTTCPYGQDKSGNAPSGAAPCLTPTGAPVTGDPIGDPYDLAQVPPQCTDRRPNDTVFFSCKCANADGRTDDGGNYCSCPSGTKCQALDASPTGFGIGTAYCIPTAAAYDPYRSCLTACDPSTATCL